MLLAIIPARGGSKGIPRKNLVELAGKPLIAYTIEAAQASNSIHSILVSTEDEEIASYCSSFGLDTEYKRPLNLAGDQTPMLDVIVDVLRWFASTRNRLPEELVLLQPTSPLRSSEDIDLAVALFRQSLSRSLVSVHTMNEHPYECIITHSRGWDYLVSPQDNASRRQDYATNFYYINGAIYMTKSIDILKGEPLIRARSSAIYEMPPERGIDIDTFLDLAVAEALMKAGTI